MYVIKFVVYYHDYVWLSNDINHDNDHDDSNYMYNESSIAYQEHFSVVSLFVVVADNARCGTVLLAVLYIYMSFKGEVLFMYNTIIHSNCIRHPNRSMPPTFHPGEPNSRFIIFHN